ncbi:hypothetical protein TG4357_03710 [Thalassovita gelatinovora]|uniref:Uncharacterized protein n=1 Tax=Thalassovita gelatinovora TaxID=53501 RepID=A0A0P1FKQ6_THAGE|nr:hypothetical protein [Thalassovita gelatinovora]CUH68638.1 hypothetical protein TG4357_03710 [Thalassovita gelatinovora]SEQ55895.1 hypothetical protein SAMN04488043_106171 [Thalassovita gelatinovora]
MANSPHPPDKPAAPASQQVPKPRTGKPDKYHPVYPDYAII